jgi:energy-coupling factor transporter transmembrane protein EcfT
MRTKAFKCWFIACFLFLISYFFWISWPIFFSLMWIVSLVGILIGTLGMVFYLPRIKYGWYLLVFICVVNGSLFFFQDRWQWGSANLFIQMHRTELDHVQFLLQNKSSPITVFEASVLDPLNQLDIEQKSKLTLWVERWGIQFLARQNGCLSIPLNPDLWQSKRLMIYDSIPNNPLPALQISSKIYLFDVAPLE